MATPAAELEAPEAEEQPEQNPEPFGKNNRDLPDQLKKAILEAIRECQDQDKYNRRVEVVEDAKHRYYDMLIQYIYQDAGFCWTQAQPGGSYNNGQESYGEYLGIYDIFHEFATKMQAKLSENAPGIDFQPCDPNQSEDVESASAAEGMRHDFDRNNDNKQRQRETVYHFQMGGRCLRWTRTETSLEKYGTNNDGTPRRASIASNYGVIESKIPIFANRLEEFPYIILYDDPDIKTAKQDYPWIKKKLKAGAVCLNESQYERIARLGVVQSGRTGRNRIEVGDAIGHLISRGHCWLRPSCFVDCDDAYMDPDGAAENTPETDEEPEHPITVAEKLDQIFPDGIHALVVGSEYAESWNQSMDDCLTVGHAMIGKGQTRMPIMRPVVEDQDRTNTTMNYIAECFDYGAPSIWLDAEEDEYAAITKQRASPYSFRQKKGVPPDGKIADHVMVDKQPEIAETMFKYLELVSQELPQNQLALPPSIWGGGEEHNETKGGRQLAANQAMEVLGVYWTRMARMDADMYYHNCLAIMNDPDFPEQVTIPGQGGQNVTVQVASLRKGNFRAFPDTESGFPESTASKRNTLTQVLTQLETSPMAAQIMGSPKNVAEMLSTYGLPEIEIPEAKSYEKQIREIETLLSQPPKVSEGVAAALAGGADVPTLIGLIDQLRAQGAAMQRQAMVEHAAASIAAEQAGGQMPPVPAPFDPASVASSSVPVWKSDYHDWEAKTCRDWMTDGAKNSELTIGRESADPQDNGAMKPNIAGVLNVYLHWMEHEAQKALEAPPMSGPLPTPNVKPPGAAAAAPALDGVTAGEA